MTNEENERCKALVDKKLLTFEGRAALGQYAAAYLRDLIREGTLRGLVADAILKMAQELGKPVGLVPIALRSFEQDPTGDRMILRLETPTGPFEAVITGKLFECVIRPHLEEPESNEGRQATASG